MLRHFLVYVAVALSCVAFAFGVPFLNLTEEAHNIYQCPDPSIVAAAPLCQLNVQKSAKFLGTITETIYCPDSGINKDKIACIIVRDNVANDHGGYASIVNGGLNQYEVDIYLKSQFGKPIDFHIEVYAAITNSTNSTYSY